MTFFLCDFPLFSLLTSVYGLPTVTTISCCNSDQGISEAGPSGVTTGGSETLPQSASLGVHVDTQAFTHRYGEGYGDASVSGGDFTLLQPLNESYSDGGDGIASAESVGEGAIHGDEETPHGLPGGAAVLGDEDGTPG